MSAGLSPPHRPTGGGIWEGAVKIEKPRAVAPPREFFFEFSSKNAFYRKELPVMARNQDRGGGLIDGDVTRTKFSRGSTAATPLINS